MLMHFGMLFADGGTGATGCLACLNLVIEQAPIRFGLAYQNLPGRPANIGTIEVGAYTLNQFHHHIFGQTGISASGTGCGANDTRFDTMHEFSALEVAGMGVGRQHLADGMIQRMLCIHHFVPPK
jgi:hypothetical protein